MLAKIKDVIERSDTPAGRVFDWTIQALIVLSLVSFSIDTLPDLSHQTKAWLRVIEFVTVAFFSCEYVARLLVADRWQAYAFSFFGIVDLLAVAPFFITGIDLRALRTIRFTRVFRLLKLARYSRAVRRFHAALSIAKEELILFGFVSLILLYLSAVGIYFFERDAQPQVFKSVFHSLWWAVTTLTTVGYGDSFPVTVGGKLFTFCVLAIGLGVISIPAGIVATALSEARRIEAEDEREAEDDRAASEEPQKS